MQPRLERDLGGRDDLTGATLGGGKRIKFCRFRGGAYKGCVHPQSTRTLRKGGEESTGVERVRTIAKISKGADKHKMRALSVLGGESMLRYIPHANWLRNEHHHGQIP